MENKIIAIVGMCGSGKSAISDYLTKKGFLYARFGQITLDIIKKKKLKISEKNEKKIRENIRKKYGMAAFAILNKPKFDKLLERGNLVADGLYSWSEYKELKKNYGNKLIVLAVITPKEIRYDRLEKRTDIDEDLKNRPISRKDAQDRDFSEIENIEKGGPIAMADIYVYNSGTKQELEVQLEKILKKIKTPKRPSWDEYFMDICKTAGGRSTCDRAKKNGGGCIMVRNKQILATGYVGSPSGCPHCDDIGHQFKTITHEDGKQSEHCIRTIHSEQNAIAQAAKNGISLNGATLYCFMTPCYTCAKMIISAGIKKVISQKDYHAAEDSKKIFKLADIELEILESEIAKY